MKKMFKGVEYSTKEDDSLLGCDGCQFYIEIEGDCCADEKFRQICVEGNIIWIESKTQESDITKLAKAAVDVFLNSTYSDKLDKEKLISMVIDKFEV